MFQALVLLCTFWSLHPLLDQVHLPLLPGHWPQRLAAQQPYRPQELGVVWRIWLL